MKKTVTKQDLLDLKDKIEDAKNKRAELTGTNKHLLEQLKEDWNCSSIKQALKKEESIDKEIDKLEHSKSKGIQELKQKYDFK